ncbi:MAG TPA: GDSL-type esterase/lipase family protein [Chloroflexota bacterium]|nr:GDSL-type esterase/lipase family protein [Chloroflexota bacterium]
MHWVGTWTAAPVAAEGVVLSNQTLRMIAHVSIGGQRVQVRLSNAYGARRLTIGSAHLSLRSHDAAIAAGSDRALTFNGSEATEIAAGALVVSDPVELDVPPLSDVAVSIYLPDDVPETFQVTGHGNVHQTSYISPAGNFAGATEMPVKETTSSCLILSGIDVLAPPEAGGIVALGDSLTDANISKLDANNRWPDELARRLAARPGGRTLGIMNQGIGGNRIVHDGRGDSGQRRFDRDVLAQPGVTHVVVLLGINDVRNRQQKPEEVVTAEQMIAGLQQMAVRAHARGLKIYGGTLLTFEHETFNPGFYSPEGEAKRQAVNAWIRESGAFDAVIDFEAALRDPSHPTRMLPIYDCGDHLHPSDAGYLHMGDSIDLALFD